MSVGKCLTDAPMLAATGTSQRRTVSPSYGGAVRLLRGRTLLTTMIVCGVVLPTHLGAQDVPMVEAIEVTEQEAAARKAADAAAFAERVANHPGDAFSPQGHWPGPIVVPDIVRPELLPMRMYHDPLLPIPELLRLLDPRLVGTSERALRDGTDQEVREVAALQLFRIARENYADISPTFPVLRRVLTSDAHWRLRRACALALAAGNDRDSAKELVSFAESAETPERLIVEAALIRWKSAEAVTMWRGRLPGSLESAAAVRLACEGLASVGDRDSVSVLNEATLSASLEFPKRAAAARALAKLDGASALVSATAMLGGNVDERLLCVELLSQPAAEPLTMLEKLADDSESAVASAAWLSLLNLSPQNLLAHLPTGRVHVDAVVRSTAARVIRLYPDAARLAWLQELMSDKHLEVRNVARVMLDTVVREHADLRDGIVGRAADCLKPESQDWQGIEQSLVLLGQIRATEFSSQAAALIDYPRAEVMAAAGWLIHLYPDETIRELVVTQVQKQEARLGDESYSPKDPEQKMAFLIQYCGLLRVPDLEPLYMQQFSKGAPGGDNKRSAGLWALALLHERDPNPDLVRQFEERAKDRGGMMPERVPVRRMANMALGIVRSSSSKATLEEAFVVESLDSMIPATAQWAMPLIGHPMMPDRPRDKLLYSGWRLNPAVD